MYESRICRDISSVGVSSLAFLVAMLCGSFYNLDNTLLRIASILVWAVLPFFTVSLFGNLRFGAADLYRLKLSLVLFGFLIVSMLVNSKSLMFEFSGPAVEKLTGLLIVFYPLTLISLHSTRFAEPEKMIRYFLVGVFVVLILDVLIRYIDGPQYFLNYSTRKEAKTLGLFTTTNVLGQFLSFFILLLEEVKITRKRLIQFCLFWILVSTMARAAVVGLIFVFCLRLVWKSRPIWKLFLSLFTSAAFLTYLAFDPFQLVNDGSLMSKFHFLDRSIDLFYHADFWELMFGFGGSYSTIVDVLGVSGWSPHLPVLKAFLYFGILGVIAYFYVLVDFMMYDRRLFFPICVAFVVGLAGAPIFWPTLLVGAFFLTLADKGKHSKCGSL